MTESDISFLFYFLPIAALAVLSYVLLRIKRVTYLMKVSIAMAMAFTIVSMMIEIESLSKRGSVGGPLSIPALPIVALSFYLIGIAVSHAVLTFLSISPSAQLYLKASRPQRGSLIISGVVIAAFIWGLAHGLVGN